MKATFFSIILVISSIACSRIHNNINTIDLDCGTKAVPSMRYVKLLSGISDFTNKSEVLVRDEDQKDWSELLTEKACIALPVGFDKQLVVSRPATGEGLILASTQLDSSMQTQLLRSYSYSSLKSPCKTSMASNLQEMPWPMNWDGVESAAYDWHLSLRQGQNTLLALHRYATENLKQEKIDLTKMTDGRYLLSMDARQLFAKDQPSSRFECEFIIDRHAPTVSVNEELLRLDSTQDPVLQAAPGEAIRIQSDGGDANNHIMSCLVPEGKEVDCHFSPLNEGYVTAPIKGLWSLFLYAIDEAGNKGESKKYRLQIYDSNLVALIRSYTNRAETEQKNSRFIQATIMGVKAYEEAQKLGSPVERKAVESMLGGLLRENSLLPKDSLILKRQSLEYTQGFLSSPTGSQLILKRYNAKISDGPLEAYNIDGSLAWTIDLHPGVNWSICRDTSEIARFESNQLQIFQNGVVKSSFLFPGYRPNMIMSSASTDCRFFALHTDSIHDDGRLLIFDALKGEITEGPMCDDILNMLNRDDESKFVCKLFSLSATIFDRITQRKQYLSEYFNLPSSLDEQRSPDGTIAILSSDNILHFITKDGQLSPTIYNDIKSIRAGSVPGEFIISDKSGLIRIIALDSNPIKFTKKLEDGTFLQANSEFVAALTKDSNTVRIWNRKGFLFGEISSSKADPIKSIDFSLNGELYVESRFFYKVYQLNTGLNQRYSPEMVDASGLSFSADSNRLFFKEKQSIGKIDQNALRVWDLQAGGVHSIELPSLPDLTRPSYPFKPLPQDIEVFQENNREYLAATINRTDIAIYASDDLNNPIEIYKMSREWLFDIALSPDRAFIAAASLDGSIYIMNRETKVKASAMLIKDFRDYFIEYPLSIEFDSTGRSLYVTDENGNVSLYGLSETNGKYTLNRQQYQQNAGMRLSINPARDTLAVVGSEGKLRLFDSNLNASAEYRLDEELLPKGESVTFSADGGKIYSGLSDGSVIEFDIQTRQMAKSRYSLTDISTTSIAVSPDGQKLAFFGGGFVHVIDNNFEKVYHDSCAWLKPRLAHIPDLDPELRSVCHN